MFLIKLGLLHKTIRWVAFNLNRSNVLNYGLDAITGLIIFIELPYLGFEFFESADRYDANRKFFDNHV